MPENKLHYPTLATAITEAQPKSASGVKTFLLETLVPILYLILPGVIAKANARTKAYLIKARDVLVASDLGDG